MHTLLDSVFLDDQIPNNMAFYKAGDTFDIRFNCAADTVEIYNSFGLSHPMCVGPKVTSTFDSCHSLGGNSVTAAQGYCNYTLINDGGQIVRPKNSQTCGWNIRGGAVECDVCQEIGFSSTVAGYAFSITSCATGRTILYADSDCTEASDEIGMYECRYYAGDATNDPGAIQILPIPVEATETCRVTYGAGDCSGGGVITGETSCGNCFPMIGYDYWFFSTDFVKSGFVDCDTKKTYFFTDAYCSEEGALTGGYNTGECIYVHSSLGYKVFDGPCL